jgi:DNA-directed RNA polymerase beta' subunit
VSETAVNDALQELLGRPAGSPALAALRLRLLTPAELTDSAGGEVLTAATLSADTLTPHADGLFCERIFGALEPEDGSREARAAALESPFVRAREDEVVTPRVRSERFGRITLAATLPHPLLSRWGSRPSAGALSGWTLEVVPVLPPDLRAIVPLPQPDGTLRFAVSDLNELYRGVLQANARVSKLRELRAPPSLAEVEHDRLGLALAQLVDNAATAEPKLGPSGRPLVGLLGLLSPPTRPAWPTLAELDGMVARGVVRTLSGPLAKRSLSLVTLLRALGIGVEIAEPVEHDPATVH